LYLSAYQVNHLAALCRREELPVEVLFELQEDDWLVVQGLELVARVDPELGHADLYRPVPSLVLGHFGTGSCHGRACHGRDSCIHKAATLSPDSC